MIFTIWLVALSIQLFIAVLLATQFTRYRIGSGKKTVKVSIVIAAHNELENLKKLLPSLLTQEYKNFEVIIALDRPSDSSVNFLKNIQDAKIRILDIQEVPEDFNPKKYALTKAVEAATGEWLVFTDADCLPASTHWLETYSQKMEGKTKIILGYSPYESNGLFLQNFIRYEAFVTAFQYLAMSLLGRPYMSVGRNMAIERSFFVEKGGYADFKQVLGGDDDLFIQKNADSKNTEIILGSYTLAATLPKKTWSAYIQQKTRHLSVGGRYSFMDQFLHILSSASHLASWVLIPFLAPEIMLPIILFYLIVKLISYRFADSKMGAGFNYMWFPLVDLTYAILLPMIALRSKLVKDIRWKN